MAVSQAVRVGSFSTARNDEGTREFSHEIRKDVYVSQIARISVGKDNDPSSPSEPEHRDKTQNHD